MQIDCSVVNTSLVKLKSDALPESLRKKNNNSSKNPAPVYNNPKLPTHKYGYVRSNKDAIDASLSDVIQILSNNVSNTIESKKQNKLSNNIDANGDLFTQILHPKHNLNKDNIIKHKRPTNDSLA